MFTSSPVLLRVTFSILFPFRFLLSKQPVVLNCHQGSQNCVFALDGGEGGANDAISLLPGWRDLEPRAKVREAFCHPLWGKELPLQPLLPLAERRQGEGKSQIWESGYPNLKAVLIPLAWSGGRTKALASVCPQVSITKQTAEA